MQNIILDKQGRLFGKISIIDLSIIIIIISLLAGFGYRRLSKKAVSIVNANTEFNVVLSLEKIRDFSINAVNEGDIIFQQHGNQPLGIVSKITTQQSKELLRKLDGTVTLVPMEDRFDMYITLECVGNISDSGYFINGVVQVSRGGELRIQSNSIFYSTKVYDIILNL